jgi:hypothetical protein
MSEAGSESDLNFSEAGFISEKSHQNRTETAPKRHRKTHQNRTETAPKPHRKRTETAGVNAARIFSCHLAGTISQFPSRVEN